MGEREREIEIEIEMNEMTKRGGRKNIITYHKVNVELDDKGIRVLGHLLEDVQLILHVRHL